MMVVGSGDVGVTVGDSFAVVVGGDAGSEDSSVGGIDGGVVYTGGSFW